MNNQAEVWLRIRNQHSSGESYLRFAQVRTHSFGLARLRAENLSSVLSLHAIFSTLQ